MTHAMRWFFDGGEWGGNALATFGLKIGEGRRLLLAKTTIGELDPGEYPVMFRERRSASMYLENGRLYLNVPVEG